MHETSLVRSLLHQVEQVAREHEAKTVAQIEVEIGPLSGVEPLLVRYAFDSLVDQTSCAGAELIIQEIVLRACCRDCHAEFTLKDFKFVCPVCASKSIRITQGDEFRLLNVTLEATEPMESTI